MISISAGEYVINNGTYTSKSGYVNNGDLIRVRLTTAAGSLKTKTATLTIGTVSSVFSVTTMLLDASPNPFSFDVQSDVPVSDVRGSNIIE